jgi:hypothetical protein
MTLKMETIVFPKRRNDSPKPVINKSILIGLESILKFRIRFNCKVSDKRYVKVIVECKVGNVRRRVAEPHSSIP